LFVERGEMERTLTQSHFPAFLLLAAGFFLLAPRVASSPAKYGYSRRRGEVSAEGFKKGKVKKGQKEDEGDESQTSTKTSTQHHKLIYKHALNK
jgi:hypothetical protein